MKRLSAQFIITNAGARLKRAVIVTDDDGTILSVSGEDELENESQSVEFYNGIIIPGFVNCHCHLELSYLTGVIPERTGLAGFIRQIRSARSEISKDTLQHMIRSDALLHAEGVVMCADICNSAQSFDIKKASSIRYLNLLEVFGIDPEKSGKRMAEIMDIAAEADKQGLIYSIVPHSSYSVSLPLFRMILKVTSENRISSIHFMESVSEIEFLSNHSGPIKESYENSGILPAFPETPGSHEEAVMEYVTSSGNLILVHNTYADASTIRKIMRRGNTYWCLCPGSNMYIENRMPPVSLLMDEGCEIVIGTDSTASNRSLSMLDELKLIQEHNPGAELEEMIRWATLNGARALCADNELGKIESGKKPGLLLLQDLDLDNFKLLPETTVKRLV